MNQKLKRQILNSKKERLKKKLVALRIPEDLHADLQALASQTDESLTGVILFLIRKGLGKI